MSLVFRLDGAGIVPVPGGARDAGPGSIVVTDCDEANVHIVARALRAYCKSASHINACDERQIVSWRSIKAAMQAEEDTAAIAYVRED